MEVPPAGNRCGVIDVFGAAVPPKRTVNGQTWQNNLEFALDQMIAEPMFRASIERSHVRDTPRRVVKAFEEYFGGIYKNPAEMLRTSFVKGDYDQMVVVSGVEFISFCAHHFAPFIGTYAFAYLPKKHIVGLSKIPRMIEILCNRPQVQEKLSHEITNIFQKVVKPNGCGIVMDAVHTCACARGVRKKFNTRTTALQGVFKKDAVKSEFLQAVRPQ